MGIVLQAGNDSRLVALEGTIDISLAADLKAALRESFDTGKSVSVSFGESTEIDITAFQLLWAARQAATARGVAFTLSGELSETATANLKDAGLEIPKITA